MNRLEIAPVPKERRPSFFGMQALVGLFGLALASEMIVDFSRSLQHSTPFLAHGNREPEIDEEESILTVKRRSSVGFVIDRITYFFIDFARHGKIPYGVVRYDGKFEIKNGELIMVGGKSVAISEESIRVNNLRVT